MSQEETQKFDNLLEEVKATDAIQELSKKHGILYLENRSTQLIIAKHNKNDVIKLIGEPHSKSIDDNNIWIYHERVFEKGKLHMLGQNVLKKNNVLILTFNKYGIINDKQLLEKDDINKLNFSKAETENNLAKKSFVANFLNSVKSKMYSNRK